MTQGRVIIDSFESSVLKNNPLKDPPVRQLTIYLPPGYENSAQNYPVVFLLAPYGSKGIMMLNRDGFSEAMDERLNRLIASKQIQPMIAVLPDCFTYYGGSQYLNSEASGQYETHLVQELVPHIKKNFRVKPEPSAWALAGHSSGGYASLVLAMRHPEVFGIAASHSGDMGFEYCYQPDFPQAMLELEKCGGIEPFMKKFYGLKKKDWNSMLTLMVVAMAACYSPNAQAGIDLPFDTKTGELRPEIWEKWLAWDPVRMIGKYRDALGKIKIFLDCGIRDEFRLYTGSRMFSAGLKKEGIEHVYEEFEDTHMKIGYRFDRSLGFISEQIS